MRVVVRPNNFDLIRLLAALQVVIVHGAEHLRLSWFKAGIGSSFLQVLQWFPGVPIFFVISGFLISRSFENSKDIKAYANNRFLRIYPALWMCLLVSIVTVATMKPATLILASTSEFIAWFVAQATIFQFFNPSFLRNYGVGVLNGSLWTIPVELQFYAAVPILYYLLNGTRKLGNAMLLVILAAFLVGNQVTVALSSVHSQELWYKLLSASMIPYFWLFLVGVFTQRNWTALQGIFIGKAGYWFLAYAFSVLLLGRIGFTVGSNNPSPALAILLACLTLSVAFSFPRCSKRVLKGNDISYGTYIYHMLVINVFVEAGWTESLGYGFYVMLITVFLAIVSWGLIEYPCLRRKSNQPPRSLDNQLGSKSEVAQNPTN